MGFPAGQETGRPASGANDRGAEGPGTRFVIARHTRLGVAQREASCQGAVVVVKSALGLREPLLALQVWSILVALKKVL